MSGAFIRKREAHFSCFLAQQDQLRSGEYLLAEVGAVLGPASHVAVMVFAAEELVEFVLF